MMNRKHVFLTAILLIAGLVFMSPASAQEEFIAPLKSNNVINAALLSGVNIQEASSKVSAPGDTLHLPFFDDFSRATVWPNQNRWSDSSAFINFNFPINPPSVGCATFDGLDYMGNPYDDTNAGAVGLCDQLTSQHIDLFADENGLPYNVSDSIALVFYYERKGRGDNPETNDSLNLEFYDPAAQQWNWIWGAKGTASGDTTFTRVKISINDPAYRQNGFRFRFNSYGSKNGMVDLWHVDYVFLNKFLPPSYDVLPDYAYVYEGQTLLNSYSGIPWKHYNSLPASQQQSLVRTDAPLTIRNNNDANPFPIKVAGTIYDLSGTPTNIVGGGGLNNIVVPLNTNYIPPSTLNSNSFFQDPSAPEQAIFTARYDIGLTSTGMVDDFPVNDTLIFQQNFHDYYSYDDGSAELAYGVNGINASIAYKFTTLKSDTLRAINIFFAQVGLSVTNQPIRLAVWAAGPNGPSGSPLYEKFNQTPNYADSINGFYTYQTDPILVPAGTWFFGFIQTNSVLINLGLDVNTPADPSKKYFNSSGAWTQSQLPGMWMIRPVFDSDPLYTDVPEINSDNILIYPNPADEFIEFSFPGFENREYFAVITDVSGREVKRMDVGQTKIETGDINSGFYFLTVQDVLTGESVGKKIIISH